MIWCITSNLLNLLLNQGATDNFHRIIVNRLGVSGFVNYMMTENFCFSNRDNIECFTFKNPDEFIQESLENLIPDYSDYKIECYTPVELRVLRGVISNEIIQMINGGDIRGATTSLGCKMDTRENLLKNFTETLEKKLERKEGLAKTSENKIRRGALETQEELDEEKLYLQTLGQEISSIKTKLKSIEDKINNAENEVCPVCYDNTSNPTIVPCCKNIFCLGCITTWNKTKRSCPMCRENLDITDFNVLGDEMVREETKLKTKMEELKILLREKTGGKVLIFSEFDNSFGDIVNFLNEDEIDYNKLRGSSGRINSILKQFRQREDKQVLLLNAKQFGSGLNLQMTTDIVFFHRMSADMEKQVIGRGQRVGRTCPLKVHYLCYENEMN